MGALSGALQSVFFFFNDTATTEIYTLSLHDALPISLTHVCGAARSCSRTQAAKHATAPRSSRSEEHTSELQSLAYLVCRLLLEKKKNIKGYSLSPLSIRPFILLV